MLCIELQQHRPRRLLRFWVLQWSSSSAPTYILYIWGRPTKMKNYYFYYNIIILRVVVFVAAVVEAGEDDRL